MPLQPERARKIREGQLRAQAEGRGWGRPHGSKNNLYGSKTHMRRALLVIMKMNRMARDAYEPRNGFEEAAIALVGAARSGGSVAVQAWREIKETLGEKVAPRQSTVETKRDTAIINDLPSGG